MITICQNKVQARWLVTYQKCSGILSTSKKSLLIFSGCLTAWAHGLCRTTNPIKFTGTFRQTVSASYAAAIWLNPSWVYTLIITLDNMPMQFLTFWLKKRLYREKWKTKDNRTFVFSDVHLSFLCDSYSTKSIVLLHCNNFDLKYFLLFSLKISVKISNTINAYIIKKKKPLSLSYLSPLPELGTETSFLEILLYIYTSIYTGMC